VFYLRWRLRRHPLPPEDGGDRQVGKGIEGQPVLDRERDQEEELGQQLDEEEPPDQVETEPVDQVIDEAFAAGGLV